MMLFAPRESSARAVFSLVSPAPMTSTSRSASELKIFSASSTATEADGNAAALDVGFGADVLGDVERALKRLVQSRAGVSVLMRQRRRPF